MDGNADAGLGGDAEGLLASGRLSMALFPEKLSGTTVSKVEGVTKDGELTDMDSVLIDLLSEYDDAEKCRKPSDDELSGSTTSFEVKITTYFECWRQLKPTE